MCTPLADRRRAAAAAALVAVRRGTVRAGHDAGLDGAFSFDNETPRHTAYTAPFELASRPVSYGDYLVLIDDGGYGRPGLWLSMGRDWVLQGRPEAPLYWTQLDGVWWNHSLQDHSRSILTRRYAT